MIAQRRGAAAAWCCRRCCGSMPALARRGDRATPRCVLFLLGLPFFFLALADPFTALVSREMSFPGRRIGIMIDASISMRTPFTAATLNKRAATDATFFTTVAAAERFVRLRMKGKYRDLIGAGRVRQPGLRRSRRSRSDYDNILLSISLIGDPVEFNRVPRSGHGDRAGGHRDGRALQGVQLPRCVRQHHGDLQRRRGQQLSDRQPVARRGRAGAPSTRRFPSISCARTTTRTRARSSRTRRWIPAIEKTGGKFYAASNEDTLLKAIEDIDRVATGTIQFKQYSSQQPRFALFALAAAAFWSAAALLKLSLPYFEKLA